MQIKFPRACMSFAKKKTGLQKKKNEKNTQYGYRDRITVQIQKHASKTNEERSNQNAGKIHFGEEEGSGGKNLMRISGKIPAARASKELDR